MGIGKETQHQVTGQLLVTSEKKRAKQATCFYSNTFLMSLFNIVVSSLKSIFNMY